MENISQSEKHFGRVGVEFGRAVDFDHGDVGFGEGEGEVGGGEVAVGGGHLFWKGASSWDFFWGAFLLVVFSLMVGVVMCFFFLWKG